MNFSSLTFNSYEFVFVFLPVGVFGYWLLRPTRWVNYWLAGASLAFYATSGLIYLLPLLFTCILDYFVGARIYRLKPGRLRTQIFVASVAIQLVILSACKYLGWISWNANAFASWVGLAVAIPVGSMTTAGHFVLHLSHHQLHGGHLSGQIRPAQQADRLHHFRCLLSAAGRRADRTRIRPVAPDRGQAAEHYLGAGRDGDLADLLGTVQENSTG
jgi:hypothetical protein